GRPVTTKGKEDLRKERTAFRYNGCSPYYPPGSTPSNRCRGVIDDALSMKPAEVSSLRTRLSDCPQTDPRWTQCDQRMSISRPQRGLLLIADAGASALMVADDRIEATKCPDLVNVWPGCGQAATETSYADQNATPCGDRKSVV